MPEKKRIVAYLDEKKVPYQLTAHPKAYTAQRIAASAHISGSYFVKTIVIKIEEKLALAVLPANERINFAQFAKELKTPKVELATEAEFRKHFPDCETGGMPPFGNLYGMDTYIAADLTKNDKLAFNACNHIDIITMKFADYQRLVNSQAVLFEVH
jgi:Ala-tRNA(Pro) deacylase